MIDILTGVTIGLHIVSAHLPARDGQENFNPGIYARHESTGITVGAYRNTLGRATLYVGETFEAGPFALTIGLASGYQRRDVPCREDQRRIQHYSRCWAGHKGGYLVPMLAPSVRLPEVLGVTPRLSFMPGLAGSSNVFHLSVERRW